LCVTGKLTNVRFGSEAGIEAPSPDVRFTPESRHSSPRPPCPLCAKTRLVSLHGVHKVRASTKEVAGLMYCYPEVLCCTMVARQIFDELPVLPAPITCGADSVDNPVENSTKRRPPACSECRVCRSANSKTCETPNRSGAIFLCLSLCRHPITARRCAVTRIAPRRYRTTNSLWQLPRG
jgi:hypothetical protein